MDEPQRTTKSRFASVVALARRAWLTFQRFPFVILSAIAAAVVFHHLANLEFEADQGADAFWPFLLAFVLGIPLFFALRMLGESRNWSRRWQLGAALFGLAALLLYYLSLPVPLKIADVFRFFVLAAAVHLWVAFAPFMRRAGGEKAFWQYNRVLFLRFALAALYSSVLYVGLTLAISTMDALLELDFDLENVLLKLWIWIALVYNTWFFVAGIPKDVLELERERDYPTGLRIFTQYVLIPLVVVYMAILYVYLVKIIIEWSLPKGWVGYPVIGLSITGVFALLLVYPIRERAENAWIVTYSKFFYWALFPLIGLLAVAIVTRIADYGITERRYLVVIASAWLFGIALYYSIKGSRNIKLIPVSLCLVSLLSAIGPWGAVAVSWRNQTARLRDLLVSNEVMTDGRLESSAKVIDFEAEKKISNIVKYLSDTHGLDRLRDWYADARMLPDDLDHELAMREMGLEYRQAWEDVASFSVDVEPPNPMAVRGYEHSYRLFEHFEDGPVSFDVALDTTTRLALEGTTLYLSHVARPADRLSAELGPMIRDLQERGEEADASDATLFAESALFRMLVYLAAASGSIEGDSIRLDYLNAIVLVNVK